MIAIGLGCRRGAAADEVVELVREAIELLPDDVVPTGLFTLADKAGEAGIAQAAATLDLPLTFLDQAALALVAGGARSSSPRVEEMFGLPGIAETAALAGAGEGAVLLVPRLASSRVTCAIAGTPSVRDPRPSFRGGEAEPGTGEPRPAKGKRTGSGSSLRSVRNDEGMAR